MRNATPLSTNVMQSMSIDQELDGQEDNIDIQPSMAELVGSSNTSRQANIPELQKFDAANMLSNLRGSEAVEQQLSVSAFTRAMSKLELSWTKMLGVGLGLIVSAVVLFILFSDMGDESAAQPAKSREELEAMLFCDGTWAQNYQTADEERKKRSRTSLQMQNHSDGRIRPQQSEPGAHRGVRLDCESHAPPEATRPLAGGAAGSAAHLRGERHRVLCGAHGRAIDFL